MLTLCDVQCIRILKMTNSNKSANLKHTQFECPKHPLQAPWFWSEQLQDKSNICLVMLHKCIVSIVHWHQHHKYREIVANVIDWRLQYIDAHRIDFLHCWSDQKLFSHQRISRCLFFQFKWTSHFDYWHYVIYELWCGSNDSRCLLLFFLFKLLFKYYSKLKSLICRTNASSAFLNCMNYC